MFICCASFEAFLVEKSLWMLALVERSNEAGISGVSVNFLFGVVCTRVRELFGEKCIRAFSYGKATCQPD